MTKKAVRCEKFSTDKIARLRRVSNDVKAAQATLCACQCKRERIHFEFAIKPYFIRVFTILEKIAGTIIFQ